MYVCMNAICIWFWISLAVKVETTDWYFKYLYSLPVIWATKFENYTVIITVIRKIVSKYNIFYFSVSSKGSRHKPVYRHVPSIFTVPWNLFNIFSGSISDVWSLRLKRFFPLVCVHGSCMILKACGADKLGQNLRFNKTSQPNNQNRWSDP